jgi:hypothetical protein
MSAAASLHFSGPFSWCSPDPAISIFEAAATRMAGIYLWTVEMQDGHLIYYVGETGTEFRRRMRQHWCDQMAGLYPIYEPELFAVGQKRALWRGLYGNDREAGLAAFAQRLPTLAAALTRFVGLMQFHLAPLTCEARFRRRIESALAQHLYRQPGLVGQFQDVGIRYVPRRAGEAPIDVHCGSTAVLLGLPASLGA